MEILKTALIHTLLGMGTVFVVLIVISLIISLFKFIPVIQEKLSKKKAGPVAAAPVQAEPVVEEVEEETDDLEIVAVITAAVAAAMGTGSTDGLWCVPSDVQMGIIGRNNYITDMRISMKGVS